MTRGAVAPLVCMLKKALARSHVLFLDGRGDSGHRYRLAPSSIRANNIIVPDSVRANKAYDFLRLNLRAGVNRLRTEERNYENK